MTRKTIAAFQWRNPSMDYSPSSAVHYARSEVLSTESRAPAAALPMALNGQLAHERRAARREHEKKGYALFVSVAAEVWEAIGAPAPS